MTTEVLRNMLLAGSDLLHRLETVVLGRGPLPPGPLPRRGVGGGPRACPPQRDLRLPLGDGLQRQRARRLAAIDPGADRGGGRGPAADHAAAPLRRAPPQRPRPVLAPLLSHRAASDEAVRIDQAVRAGREHPDAELDGPARPSPDHAPAGPLARGASSWSSCWRTRSCCRRSSSSSAGPPVTTRCASACETGCD